MAYGGSADLNWHHKAVVLLDLKWVEKTIVVHVEMRQFEDEEHQGQAPGVALSRISSEKQEDILVVTGRATGHVLVSLSKGDKLVARINQSNPNSAGTAKWEIVS